MQAVIIHLARLRIAILANQVNTFGYLYVYAVGTLASSTKL